jgi:hypothetical protein
MSNTFTNRLFLHILTAAWATEAGSAIRPPQGCSTLWNSEEVEEAIEAANGGAEAVLGE